MRRRFLTCCLSIAAASLLLLVLSCSNLSEQQNWYNSKTVSSHAAQASSSGVPGTREVSIAINDSVKVRLDASVKVKVKVKSSRRFAPSSQAEFAFVAVNPAGVQLRHEFRTNLLASLPVPTNAAWSFFIEIAETNYTNAMLLSYPDDRVQVRMAPGLNGSMDKIDLGLPEITNGRMVSGVNPADNICRGSDGKPDSGRDTNTRSFDNDNDGVMDCFAVIDRDQNGIPDIFEIAKGMVESPATNSHGVPSYLAADSSTNDPAVIASLATDPNMGFYQDAPVFTNATVRFALDDTLLGVRTNLAQAWSNTLVQVAVNTNFTVPPSLRTNWSNAVISVALDTNYSSSIPTNFAAGWSNMVAQVVLQPDYTNYVSDTLEHAWSNTVVAVSLDSNYAAVVSNLPANLRSEWSNTVAEVVLLPEYSNYVTTNYSAAFSSNAAAVTNDTNWISAYSNTATNVSVSSAASSVYSESSAAVSSSAASSETNSPVSSAGSSVATNGTSSALAISSAVSSSAASATNASSAALSSIQPSSTNASFPSSAVSTSSLTNIPSESSSSSVSSMHWTTNRTVTTNAIGLLVLDSTNYTEDGTNLTLTNFGTNYLVLTVNEAFTNSNLYSISSNSNFFTNGFYTLTNLVAPVGIVWTTNQTTTTNAVGLLVLDSTNYTENGTNLTLTNFASNYWVLTVTEAFTNAYAYSMTSNSNEYQGASFWLSNFTIQALTWTTNQTISTNTLGLVVVDSTNFSENGSNLTLTNFGTNHRVLTVTEALTNAYRYSVSSNSNFYTNGYYTLTNFLNMVTWTTNQTVSTNTLGLVVVDSTNFSENGSNLTLTNFATNHLVLTVTEALTNAYRYSISSNSNFYSDGFYTVTNAVVTVGSVWTLQTLPASDSWSAVTYGNGLFVAVAGNSVPGTNAATSPDGITWTTHGLPDSQAWNAIAFGNGTFVALSMLTNVAATSTNGSNWTLRTLPSAHCWSTVTYGNGVFVAMNSNYGGSEEIITSSNGINWTTRTLPVTNSWSSVTYGNGTFVAVGGGDAGASGVALSSTNGINWTPRTLPATNNWSSVTYGNGVFVAVSGYGTSGKTAATSTNGINWTLRTLPSTNNWRLVTYGAGIFAAFTKDTTNAAISSNGVVWTPVDLPGADWSSLTYGNGNFVGVGSGASAIISH